MKFPDDFIRFEYSIDLDSTNREIVDMIKLMKRHNSVEIESGNIRVEKTINGYYVTVAPVKWVFNPRP